MKILRLTLIAMLSAAIPNLVNAQSFVVTNHSDGKGIYIEFNQGAPNFPSNCSPTEGNPQCCLVNDSEKTDKASFNLSSGQFNISAGKCGSSGSAQAEFNLGATGVCGTHASCDIVDASTVQSATPTVIIKPSSGMTINSAASTCGVYEPGNPDCGKPQKGQPGQCPSNNYCTLNYYGSQTYSITFE